MNTTEATSQTLTLQPVHRLLGHYTPPPDKSIAHRALILSAMAEGRSTVHPVTNSADVQSTASCLRQLGVSIEVVDDTWVIESPGIRNWSAPERALDCGNSGTTMRLLAGCLAGRPFASELIGDESLSQRPMARIAIPLRKMGALIELAEGDTPPITIKPSSLRGIEYELPIASAQVKSAILLAGLDADGATTITETYATRDHTERMFRYAEVDCETLHPPRPADRREQLLENPDAARDDTPNYHHKIVLGERRTVRRTDWEIPGDFSTAAYVIAAAAVVRRSEVIIANVGINPTRTTFLKVLRRMGAQVDFEKREQSGGEPVGTLRVTSAKQLKAVRVGRAEVPGLIDELPILAVLAGRAEGITVIRGAGELRHKESDRIATVTENLRAVGVKVAELEDGWAIEGPSEWKGTTINPHGDHRIAMAFGVAGHWADGPTQLLNPECVKISAPDFFNTMAALSR
ncbi:MAG: 3-phosphoshikimate 1-carboxyvinyltransferase [candidate division Zixibacteria bacterium]|nr:3-phosphoshikimate 1-carboxyvinyltransferase [candidate division Zixibacteria bacterium]